MASEIKILLGYVIVDWIARDREIRRQMSNEIINLDKINEAAKITQVDLGVLCLGR